MKKRPAKSAWKIHKEETERGDGPENYIRKRWDAGRPGKHERKNVRNGRGIRERRRPKDGKATRERTPEEGGGKRKDSGDLIGGSGPRYFFCAQRSGGEAFLFSVTNV